jgi:ABC-type nitrate/sulfonate/bicarbonate transport system substrate-binding protein
MSMAMGKGAVVRRMAFIAGAVFFLVNAFLLAPLGIGTATAVAATAGLQKVVLVVPAPTVAFLPFYFGKEVGLYEDEGIDLQIMIMRSDMGSAGLVSGEVQYGTTLSNYVRAAAAGIPIKLVMSIDRKMEYHQFVGAKDVTSVGQLKGEKIGVTARNGNLHMVAIKVLEAHGMSDKDVAFMFYPSVREVKQALEKGAIRAGSLPPPLNIYMARNGFKILGNGPDYYNGGFIGLVASDKYLKEDRPAVVAMIRATLRSLRYIRENPTKTIDFIEKQQRTPDREIAQRLYDMMTDICSKDGEITEEWVQQRLNEMKRFGGKPKVDDPKMILDLGPLREARR